MARTASASPNASAPAPGEPPTRALVRVDDRGSGRGRALAYLSLARPSVAELVPVAALPAIYIASDGVPSPAHLTAVLAGSVLMMAGAGLAVRVVEREASELGYAVSLRRRPPARLNTAWVLVWATSVAAAGSVLAALIVNQLAALLVLGGALVYVLARSLMLEAKAERTVAAAGAAAAVQVLAGWAAATGRLEAPALVLFAMAACWTGFGLAPRKRGVLALALVAMSFVFAVVEGSGWRFWAACSVTGLLFLVGSARVGRLRPGAVATVGTVRATSLWSLLHAAAFLYAAVWLGLPAR